MPYKKTFYPESRFGGFSDIDGTMVFYNRVNALLDPSYTVLDVGCGRGEYQDDPVAIRRGLRVFQGKVEKVVGIDVDKGAQENPFLDEFHLLDSKRWPIDEKSVNMVVCDNVLEHVENPPQFFSEMRRVLKDEGCFCIRTPNAWSYISLAARMIPNKFHSRVTRFAQNGRKEEDVFPTLYRCNTVGRMKSMAKKHGFESVVYSYEAEPSYLAFSKIAYGLGKLHQKYAPRFMKPAIFAFGQKVEN